MSVSVVRNSRLHFSDLVTVDGYEFWDLAEAPNIEPQNDDIYYNVSGEERIDTIATKFYGDPTLWWVIALANDLEILPTDLGSVDTLRIPAPRYVAGELFAGRR